MSGTALLITCLMAVLVVGGPASGAGMPSHQGLGIAEKYPGDVGIERDPAVLLYEGFEEPLEQVGWMQPGGWFDIELGPGKGVEISDTHPAAGGRCLQFNLKQGKQGSGGMFRLIRPSDTVHLRYYRRFDTNWQWPDGYGPHDAMIFGGAFHAPTDTDLTVYVDFWQTGDTMVRISRARQKLDYDGWRKHLQDRYPRTREQNSPGGNQFPWHRAAPARIVPGQWHCVEMMAKLSTPGEDDGEIRLWVNGEPVSAFADMRLRDNSHPDLKLNMVFLVPYFHPGSPRGQTQWVDAIVVATEYIGPIAGRPDCAPK